MAHKETYPLLCQLPRLLVLGVPQQLHYPTLIGRESSDLPDDGADELCSCRCDALAVAGLSLLLDRGGRVTLVEADTEV